MLSRMLRALMICAVVVAAPSCANRVETRLASPPVADLKVDPEPPYPEAALEPGDAGKAAEDKWWNDVLIWGRVHHDRVQRICQWARELKMDVSGEYCGKP